MLSIKFPLGICTKWPISIFHYICSFDTIEVLKSRTEGVINLHHYIKIFDWLICIVVTTLFHDGQPTRDGVRKIYEGVISTSPLGTLGLRF